MELEAVKKLLAESSGKLLSDKKIRDLSKEDRLVRIYNRANSIDFLCVIEEHEYDASQAIYDVSVYEGVDVSTLMAEVIKAD